MFKFENWTGWTLSNGTFDVIFKSNRWILIYWFVRMVIWGVSGVSLLRWLFCNPKKRVQHRKTSQWCRHLASCGKFNVIIHDSNASCSWKARGNAKIDTNSTFSMAYYRLRLKIRNQNVRSMHLYFRWNINFGARSSLYADYIGSPVKYESVIIIEWGLIANELMILSKYPYQLNETCKIMVVEMARGTISTMIFTVIAFHKCGIFDAKMWEKFSWMRAHARVLIQWYRTKCSSAFHLQH